MKVHGLKVGGALDVGTDATRFGMCEQRRADSIVLSVDDHNAINKALAEKNLKAAPKKFLGVF